MNEENAGRVSELKPCPFCGGTTIKVEEYSSTSIYCNCGAAMEGEFPRVEAAIAAWNLRAADHPAVGVRVKPLAWIQESKGRWRAPSVLGTYEITHYDGMRSGGFKLYCGGGGLASYYSSLDAANTSAQDDYRERILSCIEPLRPATEQAASATLQGEPVAFITERTDGSNRQIMPVEKYDPRNPEFWVNEAARAGHRIIPLYASPPSPAATQSAVVSEDRLPTREEAAQAALVLLRCNGYDLATWGAADLLDDVAQDGLAALSNPKRGE